MPDTLIAPSVSTDSASLPAPAGSVVSAPEQASSPAPATRPSIADATKAYLASLSPEAASQPLAEPERVEDTPETLAADLAFEPPTFDEATGQWRNKDGTFAAAPETATDNSEPSSDNSDAAAVASAPEADPPAPEIPVHRVELKGRNGETVPIEVTDEATAELLRANANDGLRRDEFNRRIEGVQQREAELRAFETALKTNPDEVVLGHMPPDAQARIAVALIAQHWDTIYPTLEQMAADPSHRIVQATQAQLRIANQRSEYSRVLSAEQRGLQLEAAVRNLVPESVDQATADRFLRDAVSDLTYHMQQRDVAPEDVPTLLADRVALYGFRADAPTTGIAPTAQSVAHAVPATGLRAPSGAPAAPAIPVARPVAAAATSASATRAAPVAAPVDAARIAQQQQARARAAASAPAGAGAPPVSVRVPVEATKSIEDASRYLRQNVRTW